MEMNHNFLQSTEQLLCRQILHNLFDIQLVPAPESLCGKRTCTTTTSRRSGRERRKQGGRCQKSEQSIKKSKYSNSHFNWFVYIFTNCRYTHYDENGHRIDERVTNERYTSQFDSDPADSAFGNKLNWIKLNLIALNQIKLN